MKAMCAGWGDAAYADEPTAAELADEIFRLVEAAQGHGFVSDGLAAMQTPNGVFSAVRVHLRETERAARIMRKWLKTHGEL